jgi:hypothetical protein
MNASALRRHPIRTGLAAVIIVLALIAAPSFVSALTRPGTDSVAARVAEWARTHGFSGVINFAERIQYDLHPPKVGGKPNRLPSAAGPAGGGRADPGRDPRALPLPAAIHPLVSPPFAGEGQWRTVAAVGGLPAIAVAFMRPDTIHTSYVSGLVWMNPRLLTFQLHPGSLDPGAGPWGEPETLPPGRRTGLMAAFNSGFRLYASQGGWWADGHTADPLRVGAASFVIYRNGSATVGQWGRDVSMNSQVVAVRQNLDLIIDHGQTVPGLAQNLQSKWGYTLGNRYYVWRSGVGVRPDGSLVYAAGNSLSVLTLAQLLQRAGCVRAMELDINPEWTSYVLFDSAADPADPVPHNLLPDMQPPPQRYYSLMSRDFFAVYARP